MQMYRVKFAIKLADDMTDLGEVIVCAHSNEAACDMVSTLMHLTRSGIEMEAHRIKPSLFQISRRTIKNTLPAYDGQVVDAAVQSRATFPNVTENRADWYWFEVSAQANIKAENENEAISKLAIGISREMSGEKQKRSITDLDIKCDRKELRPRSPAVEENAVYAFTRIFQGGDTRT